MTQLDDAPIAVTAMILRNKGVPVQVFRTSLVTDTNEDGEIVSEYRPVMQEDGDDPVQQERHIRFDANAFVRGVSTAVAAQRRGERCGGEL